MRTLRPDPYLVTDYPLTVAMLARRIREARARFWAVRNDYRHGERVEAQRQIADLWRLAHDVGLLDAVKRELGGYLPEVLVAVAAWRT